MDPLGADAPAMLQQMLDTEYRKVFGRDIGGISTGEIVAWSLVVRSEPHRDHVPAIDTAPGKPLISARRAFDAKSRKMLDFSVINRKDMAMAGTVEGPAIIVEDETSIIVSSAFRARVVGRGHIALSRKQAE